MQFLRRKEELLHYSVLRIELYKLSVHEGVETAQIRAHAVCRQRHAGNMECKGLTVFGAVISQTRTVQTQFAAADDLGGGLVLQQFKLRQHTQLHLFFQNEVLLLYFLADQLPFHLEPGGLGLGDHTSIIEGNQLIGIQQSSAVAAFFAENGIARSRHGVLLAAAGAPEEQIFQIFGTVLANVIMVLVDLIPGIVIMIDRDTYCYLSLFFYICQVFIIKGMDLLEHYMEIQNIIQINRSLRVLLN